MADLFNEESLRAALVSVWGEHGAHVEVYDHILREAHRRSSLADSGLAYCTAHNGIIECDGGDGPCDFQGNGDPDFKCPTCDGAGVVDEDEADGLVTCTRCEGDGLTPCKPTPLLYEPVHNGTTDGDSAGHSDGDREPANTDDNGGSTDA